jgi:hypothetical protein
MLRFAPYIFDREDGGSIWNFALSMNFYHTTTMFSESVCVRVFRITTFQTPDSPSLTLVLTLCHWTLPEPHTPFGANM